MSFPDLNYIEATSLVSQLEKSNGNVVIIDVRNDDEFASGHIKGAENLPSANWTDESFVDGVIQKYSGAGAAASRSIVVHCAHSQKRGPTCAQILQDRIKQVSANGAGESSLPSV